MKQVQSLITTAILGLSAVAVPARGEEAKPKLRQVIVAFKTHFDIGYTEMAREVVEKYRAAMIDKALAVCDQSRALPREQRFVWTLPGWPMSQILWEGQTGDRRRRVLAAFRQGQFVVHALPFTTHTETLELEDLVRGLGYSSRLARSVGLELPRDAKMTDVPCHSWVLPTLLKHAGVNFLHLGCNPASASPEIPKLFWWEGPDGSRLLTMYMAGGYGSNVTPPEEWPYASWLALIHTGDNQGPPEPKQVRQILEEAHTKMPDADVRIGRMSDFADAILREDPKLPVVRGDMPDTWIHGPMSDPQGAGTARWIRPVIAAAETLNTHLKIWGIDVPAIDKTVGASYEQSLLYGEHTWGGALWWIKGGLSYGDRWAEAQAEGKHKRIEESWEEHSAYIKKSHRLITPVLTKNLEALAKAVNVNGNRIVVYNPLPWARDGLVTVRLDGNHPAALKPIGGDLIAPVESNGDSIRFLARGVPAMGYVTYIPAEWEANPKSLTVDQKNALIENQFFRVKLDAARGIVVSLIEKLSGRELVDTTASQGYGQFLYERFDRNTVDSFVDAYVTHRWDWAVNELGKSNLPGVDRFRYRSASPRDFTLELSRTDVSASAVMKAPPTESVPCGITTRVTLYHEKPVIDLEVVLRDKPADPWPEAGWVCLPLKVDSPEFRLGRIGSVTDPVNDIVPGANHHCLWINTGLGVIDAAGSGVGLCPVDSPCVSLDRPGLWLYSRRFIPTEPRVYVNLFNNQWTTNFRLWNRGTWSSRIRLWAISKYNAGRSLIVPSWEIRSPLLATAHVGPAGTKPPSRTGLQISSCGVLVTTFGANPDGSGIVLRLWEQAGESGICRVRWPQGMSISQVQACDLRGRPMGKPVPFDGRGIEVPVKAYAPVSLILKPQD